MVFCVAPSGVRDKFQKGTGGVETPDLTSGGLAAGPRSFPEKYGKFEFVLLLSSCCPLNIVPLDTRTLKHELSNHDVCQRWNTMSPISL